MKSPVADAALQPAGNHDDEHVEDHGVSQVKDYAVCALQYTLNLRYLNRMASAVCFNHTLWQAVRTSAHAGPHQSIVGEIVKRVRHP
jgi:hypothetical protein